MTDRAERVKQQESTLVERAFEILSSIAAVKSFARERHELDRFSRRRRRDDEGAAAADVAGVAVLALRSPPSRSAGTALVLVVGGLHVLDGHADRRRPAGGDRLPGRRLRPAVVDRAHDRHRCSRRASARGACARCSRSTPEALDVDGRASTRRASPGDIVFEDVSFAYDDEPPDPRRHQLRGAARASWWRWSASPAPARRPSPA